MEELQQLLPPDAEQLCQPKVQIEAGNASKEVLQSRKRKRQT